jgi:acetyltransferase-like isoleucine patch superfamily enzyme
MLISKYKNIKIIGYLESSLTQEVYSCVSNDTNSCVEVVTPDQIINSSCDNYDQFSYMVAFQLDRKLRQQIINQLANLNLDCATYLHETAILSNKVVRNITNTNAIPNQIGAGSFFGPNTEIQLETVIGRHCVISCESSVGHYSRISDNVILQAGTMFCGRVVVGTNCEFNFRSTVLPTVNICDNVWVGALTNVTKNITSSGKYVGYVARKIGPWED